MRVDKTKWENALIKDAIKTLKVKDAIQKKDYLLTGKYPIISQEKDFISGYCNTEDNLNKNLGDVVIFGDHTRTVKYVDFNFCAGADGVKVLQPDNKLFAKYLYYFIKWSNIPSNGYSRHFKFLKEIEIKYPKDKAIQHTIASELDAIQTMINGYKAQLNDLDALAQSIFLDMFGDPVSNPKGWEKKKLGELGTISSGGTPLRSNSLYYKGNIDWYSAGELNHLYLNGSNEKITKEAIKESSTKLFKANSLFIGLYDTAAFKLGITLKEASANQACANLFPANDNIIWIYYCLLNMKEYAWTFRKGIRQKNLTVGFIKSFSIPLPPLPLQQQFSNQVEAIEKQKELIKSQLTDAETLMAERMQYYFS